MNNISVSVAELHADQVEHYDLLHARFPLENTRDMRESGYNIMKIFRIGTLLVMYLERDAHVQASTDPVSQAASQRWHALTAPMFAKPWSVAKLIFDFDALAQVDRRDG